MGCSTPFLKLFSYIPQSPRRVPRATPDQPTVTFPATVRPVLISNPAEYMMLIRSDWLATKQVDFLFIYLFKIPHHMCDVIPAAIPVDLAY